MVRRRISRSLFITLIAMVFASGMTPAAPPVETCAASSPAAEDSGRKGMLEFLRERGKRRWTRVPRQVLAFYYTWYGRPERHGRWIHWGKVRPEQHDISASTHFPAKGAYDSHDPAIIDYHIDLARSHGVDGFICTWWGQGSFDDRALVKVLERARAKQFTVTVYWETVPGQGQAKIDRAVRDLLYVLNRYGSHPAFLKVEGKPVVFVYGRVMGQVGLSEWQAILEEAGRRYSPGFLLIADGYSEGFARLFDGVHTYNICGWVQKKTPGVLRKLSRDSFTAAVKLARRRGKISCLTVIPGYDDTKIRSPGINAERLDGKTYEVLWEEAIAADPDWVLITSWNEWHEGSEIEPSWEHGDHYIKSTGKFTRRFKKTPFSPASNTEVAQGIPPEKSRALRRSFAGKTIAVLPDFTGDAAFWLAESGIELAEPSWEDLVSPDRFSPSRFPVAVYAGYENYRQSVKDQGDVDRALVRYLKGGGLLMVLPAGPFPFFYNERGVPVQATGRLGIPIHGGGAAARDGARGWEEPPAGTELVFEVDTARLDGLPARIAFPRAGDRRWRPCSPGRLDSGDLYLPLARLKDERGQSLGDGIAYIEHRASPPVGGKILYAWMRMPDICDRNDLLFNLFRLAAEKMKR